MQRWTLMTHWMYRCPIPWIQRASTMTTIKTIKINQSRPLFSEGEGSRILIVCIVFWIHSKLMNSNVQINDAKCMEAFLARNKMQLTLDDYLDHLSLPSAKFFDTQKSHQDMNGYGHHDKDEPKDPRNYTVANNGTGRN